MCECCTNKDFWSPVVDLANWIPVGIAIVTYFIQAWVRQGINRREQSRLAVMYLKEIEKEIQTGLERLVYLYEHGGIPFQVDEYKPLMPVANWDGIRGILPDAVNMRMLNVIRRVGESEECIDLRHHLKNYYTVICKFGNDVIKGREKFCKEAAREDIDGTRMILSKMKIVIQHMDKNSRRLIWPW